MNGIHGWSAVAGAALIGLLAVVPFQGAAAQAQTAPRANPSPSALDAARAAFEALPEADRRALQEALIWIGDYNGSADGTFGRQTYDVIAALQQSAGKPPTGILSPSDRKAAQDAAQKAKALVGFTLVDDPRSGVRIGVPGKLLPKQDVNPNGGSRWQSADGRITLDTRLAPPDATLQSLYDRNVAIQTPGRVVTYKVLRPDFFVIAGETPTGKFYTRYASGAAGLRGFSIGYDKALAAGFDRVVVAIAGSFTPFPAPTPAAVAQTPAPAPQAAPAQSKPQRPRLIGTGLAVGPRQVITAARVDSCKVLSVNGLKPQQVKGKGTFLLEFADALATKPVGLTEATMTEGAALLVVAFNDGEPGSGLAVAPAWATGPRTLGAPLQPGAGGAPVFDDRRALVGLVGPVSSDQRRIAGVTTSASYDVVPVAEILKAFPEVALKGAEPAAQRMRAADISGSVKGALVPIACEP